MNDVTLKNRSTVYRDPFLRVERREYEHDGRGYAYFVKNEPDFSVCGAVTDTDDILMVRQFRPGPGRFTYDVPGGMVEKGATPEETARQELLEETGYVPGKIWKVTTCFVTAYSTARKHIFIASDCRKVAEPEEEENMVAAPAIISQAEFRVLLKGGNMLDLDCCLYLDRYLTGG